MLYLHVLKTLDLKESVLQISVHFYTVFVHNISKKQKLSKYKLNVIHYILLNRH